MIKNIAWNVFKNTGDINTFLEFKQIKDIENQNMNFGKNIENRNNIIQDKTERPIIQRVELDGDNKNKWNNNF